MARKPTSPAAPAGALGVPALPAIGGSRTIEQLDAAARAAAGLPPEVAATEPSPAPADNWETDR